MFATRTAQQKDAIELSAMMIKSWRESYSHLVAPEKLDEICTNWLNPAKFKERLADKNASNLVALVNNSIVGHCYALPRAKNSVLIAYLYVLKEHQRKGIAKTLLRESASRFPGTSHLELSVLDRNFGSIEFYKSQGFYEAGPEPKADGEPPSIKMTKVL